MKCPVCKEVDLKMADRQGVEIDYCPQCRGVWLDRGELDKIIERSAPAAERDDREPDRRDYGRDYDRDRRDEDRSRPDDDDRYRRDDDRRGYEAPKKKRRESFLGELFDF
jgi:hypothetical protein